MSALSYSVPSRRIKSLRRYARRSLLLWLVFLPCGFVARNRRTSTVIAVSAAVYLLAGPLLLGFAATPWYQVGSAIAGIATGYVMARLYRARIRTRSSDMERVLTSPAVRSRPRARPSRSQ